MLLVKKHKDVIVHYERRHRKAIQECEEFFLAVIKTCPKFHSNPYFYLGYLYYNQGKYDSAVKYCKKFLDFSEDNVKKYEKNRYDGLVVNAKEMIKFSKFNSTNYGISADLN